VIGLVGLDHLFLPLVGVLPNSTFAGGRTCFHVYSLVVTSAERRRDLPSTRREPMPWLTLMTGFCLQAAVVPEPAPRVEIETRVFVKLRAGHDLGVDRSDRWVVTDADARTLPLPAAGIRFAGPAELGFARDRRLVRELGLDRWFSIELDDATDESEFIDRLRRLGAFETVELDAAGGLASGTDDPFFGDQWGLENTGQVIAGTAGVSGADVNALEAWEITTGGAGIVVATLDSGAYPHVDLTGRVLPGRNIPNGTGDGTDVCGSHGTAVAGIIAAAGDNGTGMAGMVWDARILPVVVVDPCGGMESWVADGLVWAVDNGADIVNMSLQYSTGTAYLRDAVLYASASDVPMVAATGNSAGSIAYPARWPEVIAVGGMTHIDTRWSSSNFGPEIDLVAPGYQVLSAQSVSSYVSRNGTSFACPHVSGAVGLLLTIDPDLTNDAIRDILNGSARDIALLGWDPGTGHGCLDARAALDALGSDSSVADLNNDGAVDGEDLLLVISAWGTCDGCPQDFNDDGIIDGGDLTFLLSEWTS